MYPATAEIVSLQEALGVEWKNINKARGLAASKRGELKAALAGKDSEDISVVVFGSLARNEFTDNSDIDWTLLIDGSADPKHLDVTREVGAVVDKLSSKPVGQEATFGTMAFSHEIVHQIGGEDDSNKNTTRRILLLLESAVIGRREAYDRVFNNVLDRYLLEDRRFLEENARYHVPRFLLNDFARYWRTMAVDFAYKRRTRALEGAAVRNIKLRMSRKLIYVSGLLTCFACHLELSDEQRKLFFCKPDLERRFVDFFRTRLRRTPLDTLAAVFHSRAHLHDAARKIFGAYDRFLGVLLNPEMRERLNGLSLESQGDDALYQQLRKDSHEFRDGLLDLFFRDDNLLAELTLMYGVFKCDPSVFQRAPLPTPISGLGSACLRVKA